MFIDRFFFLISKKKDYLNKNNFAFRVITNFKFEKVYLKLSHKIYDMRKLIIELFDMLKMIINYSKRQPFLFILILINIFFYWYLKRIENDTINYGDYRITEDYGGWYIEAQICYTEDYERDGGAIQSCDYEAITDDLGSEENAERKLEYFNQKAEKKLEKDDFLKFSKLINPTLLRYLIHILSFIIWIKIFYKKKDK